MFSKYCRSPADISKLDFEIMIVNERGLKGKQPGDTSKFCAKTERKIGEVSLGYK